MEEWGRPIWERLHRQGDLTQSQSVGYALRIPLFVLNSRFPSTSVFEELDWFIFIATQLGYPRSTLARELLELIPDLASNSWLPSHAFWGEHGSAAELRVGDRVFAQLSSSALTGQRNLGLQVAALLNAAPFPREPWHGMCAETWCIDQALKEGLGVKDLRGGQSVGVFLDGDMRPPCERSCKPMLSSLGIGF